LKDILKKKAEEYGIFEKETEITSWEGLPCVDFIDLYHIESNLGLWCISMIEPAGAGCSELKETKDKESLTVIN